jgi:predicted NBD/HSP70 family sugar kinase
MSLRATNVSHGKLVNLWVVFETIRLHGPLSRSDIARLTTLSKPSVSSLVDELDELGLIREGALRTGGVGKPSTPLDLNPEGAFTLGLHLDYGRATAVLTDLIGGVRHREVWALDTSDQLRTLRTIARQIKGLLRKGKVDRTRLMGMGLVMPGPFGVAGLSPTRLPRWDGIAVRAALEADLRMPVMLANDGTGAAMAEWRFGAAKGHENFVYVFVGNGIGTGLVANGRLVGGEDGNAGEIAHVVVRPEGHACICGKHGCLETYISLDSALHHLSRNGVILSSMEEFERCVKPGDALVEEWLAAAIGPFRLGINLIENLFNPEAIYLGGDFPPWLLDLFMSRILPLPISVNSNHSQQTRLRRAALGQDAAAIGAAALAVAASLNPDYLQRVQARHIYDV